MGDATPGKPEATYPLRAAARLTGLSPELLRAWERRHGVVTPQRTAGGTRRYTVADLERLRLVKAAVDAGHRIGRVAQLDLDALRDLSSEGPEASGHSLLRDTLDAISQLDSAETHRLLSIQLLALGPLLFVERVALPLAREIGDLWSRGTMSVAAEHMATHVLRSLLGSALIPGKGSAAGPRIAFATPPGEPHDLGLQMAALSALGAGAFPIFLGAQVPIEDLAQVVHDARIRVVALGLVTIAGSESTPLIRRLREAIPPEVHIWIGGAASADLELSKGLDRIASFDDLSRRVALLAFETEE